MRSKHASMALQKNRDYQLIESTKDLEDFCYNNRGTEYLCIDTEFVGEKRYHTTLCLIQIATPDHNYLIDPFEVEDLSAFLELVQNPAVTKITHAGENDYRLFYKLYDVLPQNVFDTQIAAGFLGYKYPISYKKLVKQELDINIDKGMTVANWESRPISDKQLGYALYDVIPLKNLYEHQQKTLIKKRIHKWAANEFSELESEEKYKVDPHREAIKHNLMPSLRKKEQLFLIRLLAWRRELAKQKNQSRDMVLPNKYLSHIVRSMNSGKQALRQNRRISNKILEKYWEVFSKFYNQPETDEEKAILKRIPVSEKEDPNEEILLEFLYLLIKQRASKHGIATDIAFSRTWLKQLKNKEEKVIDNLKNNWRSEFLGPELIRLIEKFPDIDLHFDGNKVEITS